MKYNKQSLIERINNGEELSYIFFWRPCIADGKYSTFSQWYKSSFVVDGVKYCCMEQYMMAAKAKLFEDEETLHKIMNSTNPKNIKALGRNIANFDDTKWSAIMDDVVVAGNISKFSQNPLLMKLLLSTEDKILVEASPFDKRWGIGIDAKSSLANDPTKWLGDNRLGFDLMRVRDILRERHKRK